MAVLVKALQQLIRRMRVLIYGARGWIGEQFVSLFKEHKIEFVIGTKKSNYEDEIKTSGCSHVIACIGRTHGGKFTTIDYLEQPGKLRENINDNLYSPIIIANACREMNIHFTYLGTGCIFKYDDTMPPGGFSEESAINFYGSSYSTVKGFTDQILKSYDNVLNLRIRLPITSQNNPRNLITKITSYDKICSVPNSVTVLPVMLPYILKMMEKRTSGTHNLTNPGVISHNEILSMYRSIVDPKFTWKNFSEDDMTSKRSNTRLDTSKIEKMFPDIPGVKEAVRGCLLDSLKNS
jgi:dTDP-4-dehydrorhamnose reductase